jgi:multiple sugar transport system substrate-binding protein
MQDTARKAGVPAKEPVVGGGGRRRRRAAAAALVAAGSLILAACGGDGGSGADQGSGGGDTTLTFVNAQDPGTFDEVIASFEKDNPGITIEEEVVPFDDLNSTVQARLGGQDPTIDLYDVDAPRLAAFASRGYLEDVSDLAEQAEGKVDPTAVETGTFDGTHFALPRWTSSQLLYYNADLLAAAGVTPPSADPTQPVTWEDVTTQAAAAQAAGAEWGMTFDQVNRYYQLQPLPESLGGGPGLSGDDMLTPDVDNDEWVEAFSWYGSIFEEGLAPRGVAPEQTPQLFAAGSTAFFVGGAWNVRSFADVEGLNYGVAPFPTFADGEPASSTGSWMTGISPFSDDVEAAKKFLSYMTIETAGAQQSSSSNIPVQLEAQKTYLDSLSAEGEVFAQIADIIGYELENNAVPRPTTVGYVEFETEMNKAFEDIANGSDARERLEQASAELERALAKYDS